jgi:hypothetical protein
MESQEALKRIRREAGFPYFSTLYDIDMWREDFKTIERDLDKLEQLEDIEKELGVSLITLLKAQTDGFYVKTACGIFSVLLSEWKFNLIKKEVHRIQFSDHYYFKDYGKTWALTKEELE